jgi:hypothetical protein
MRSCLDTLGLLPLSVIQSAYLKSYRMRMGIGDVILQGCIVQEYCFCGCAPFFAGGSYEQIFISVESWRCVYRACVA